MLSTFRRSRGWGKLRRNRGAMIALYVIGAYVLLAAFVWGAELLHTAGRKLDAFDLSRVPIAGALLPERTAERVGPRWLPGFGAAQDTARREDQADFVFKLVTQAIDKAEAAYRKQGQPGERTPAQIFQEADLGERKIADVPMPELRERVNEAKAKFAALDDAKKLRSRVSSLQTALGKAEQLAASVASTSRSEPKTKDDLAAAVEEVMFQWEDLGKTPGTTLAPKDADLKKLQDDADAIRGTGPVPSAAEMFGGMRERLAGEAATLMPKIDAALTDVERAVDRLMPIPGGFDGLSYRVRTLLGTDAQGRSILVRSLYSTKVAIQVGLVVALVSVLIGSLLGAAAAYFGGWVDHVVTWLYSTLSSLPQLVLLAVVAFMFLGSTYERSLLPVYVALCSTFWIGPCRVIRGEVLKIKELEYAQAATVIGFSRMYILLKHVLPNTTHLMFINFSLLFIGAIKSEVILTFLGLGLKEGASWGLMISQAAPEVVSGIFWQLGAATVFMLVLVLAFNVLSDALQDAFDPRHVG